MDVIWFLVPSALLMGLGFLGIFIWAAKSGQFEDLETPAVRILFDEKKSKEKENLK